MFGQRLDLLPRQAAMGGSEIVITSISLKMLAIIIEIYRCHRNWIGTRQRKPTPAMKLGIAKRKIYERDLFG